MAHRLRERRRAFYRKLSAESGSRRTHVEVRTLYNRRMSEATVERRVHRFEIRPVETAGDPVGDRIRRAAGAFGVSPKAVHSTRIYLIEAELTEGDIDRIGQTLLSDPVLEAWSVGAHPAREGARLIEVHPLPGVMDPAAQTVRDAVAELTGGEPSRVDVMTGYRYEFVGVESDDLTLLGERLLANGVVEAIHMTPWMPDEFPHGHQHDMSVHEVAIRELDDAALEQLSREAHLFLSLDEMRAIRDEYRELGREPREIELETLAQTWSEHCVHKTLKSTVMCEVDEHDSIEWRGRPGTEIGDDGRVTIHNLLKSTVAAATHELIADGVDWTLSVFVDNAGIIEFDEQHAVCVKVETHNHPSAIEPYGGAATGIGGCIRDVMGTGLAARPIANTDVFCVAHPDHWRLPSDEPDARALTPAGCLHPGRVLRRVVDGVRDYGNRMGIPTLSGGVWFDDRYIGNPLVFAGCVGVMPRDAIAGAAQRGDRIIALGGRTGRDGIHGATFSSAELTDSHADEFSHAVQIGNAIEEKRTLDAIMRARDAEGGPLYSAITDCGAGGFSSAVGEMGEEIGAYVQLERAPLKYAGLTPTEIWISESQERMVLAVAPEKVAALQAICDEEHVELCDLGTFGTDGAELVLTYDGSEVGRLPMSFLHGGIPMPTREADCRIQSGSCDIDTPSADIGETLLRLLAHPNIASKHWIIEQYDHEVQGATVLRPQVGAGRGPGDASVVEPVPGSGQGLAISCGLATAFGDPKRGGDPYDMVLGAIDECVRNLVCVGADPKRIAILDNFCWPSCGRPENLGMLVRAAVGCYDGAKAYRTPFVSGKDSLNNQFKAEDGRTIEIPPTLLITGIGIVPDLDRCITMDAKAPGNVLLLVRVDADIVGLGCSHVAEVLGFTLPQAPPLANPVRAASAAAGVASLIAKGRVCSAHDCSEGGALVAVAEMLIASGPDGGCGCDVESFVTEPLDVFAEGTGRYILEVRPGDVETVVAELAAFDTEAIPVGTLSDSGRLRMDGVDLSVVDLHRAWFGTLDW